MDAIAEYLDRRDSNLAPTLSGFRYDPRFADGVVQPPPNIVPPRPVRIQPVVQEESPDEKSRRAKVRWLRAHGFMD